MQNIPLSYCSFIHLQVRNTHKSKLGISVFLNICWEQNHLPFIYFILLHLSCLIWLDRNSLFYAQNRYK